AAITLGVMCVSQAATQFLFPPRIIVASATIIWVGVSVLFVLAGQWYLSGVCALMLGATAAFAIYGQARTKVFLRRIFAETEARTREVTAANVGLRRQVAERSRDLSELLAKVANAPVAPRLSVDEVVAKRYRLVRRLGAGGMGEVFEVERITDRKRLALKV